MLKLIIKIIGLSTILFTMSGCVKFACFPNTDYAISQACEFCKFAGNDKDLCESIKVNDLGVCAISNNNTCMPLGNGVKNQIINKYNECKKLSENTCSQNPFCEWTFNDPARPSYGDFLSPKAQEKTE